MYTVQLSSSSSSSLNDKRLEFAFTLSADLSFLCVFSSTLLSELWLLSSSVLAFLLADEADNTLLLLSLDRFDGLRNTIRPYDSAPNNTQQHTDNKSEIIPYHSTTRRCGMEVPHDGRPAKYRCGKKRCAVLSKYKANVNEAWQLSLQRDVIKCICFSFSICSLIFEHEFRVAPSPNCGAKFADFCTSKCRRYK